MSRNLTDAQLEKKIDLRVYYYELRKIGLKNFQEEYVDMQSSKVIFWISPLFLLKRLKIASKLMLAYYKSKHDFNCIHAHTLFFDGYIAYEAYKKWKIPYVITVRSCDLYPWYLWKLPVFKEIGTVILKNSAAVTFLSSISKIQLLNFLPPEMQTEIDRKSYIIPNGISQFWLEKRQIKRLNDDDRCICIVTVGTIEKRKNQISVLHAVKLLEKEGYSIKYIVVGKRKHKRDQRIVERLKKSRFTEMIPYSPKEELVRIYDRCHIYVMPSYRETFGLSYAEAMSQGLPVIYSKGQGFEGQFDEGMVGYAVIPGSPKDIACAIKKIISRYNAISSMCSELSVKFSWEDVAERYFVVYQRLV